jgi:hypothetical protein
VVTSIHLCPDGITKNLKLNEFPSNRGPPWDMFC